MSDLSLASSENTPPFFKVCVNTLSYNVQVGFSVSLRSAADEASNADTAKVPISWSCQRLVACCRSRSAKIPSMVGTRTWAFASLDTKSTLLSSATLPLSRGQQLIWESR